MKAIVSVIGKDKRGIIAKVSTALYELEVNVEDISQTILQEYFAMIMSVEISQSKISFAELSDKLAKLGKEIGVEIHIQTKEIFDAMHEISMNKE